MRTLVLVLVGLLVAGTASAHGRFGHNHCKSEGHRSYLTSDASEHRHRSRSHRLDRLFNSNLNSGVCDELKDATPGLRLMCMAFCELQTCEPDYTAEDPFENCSRSSKWILDRYEARRGPGDPEMPCVKQPETSVECPCWTRNELANFRGQSATDRTRVCVTNLDNAMNGNQNQDAWQIMNSPAYTTALGTIGVSGTDGGAVCQMADTCDPATEICLGQTRMMSITPEQLAACEADIAMSAADRGLTCTDYSE